jgi:hypothetical protein
MSSPEDRPRGILTKSDRSLLLGHVEYEHNQQYSDRRRKIRERITNGVLDFSSIQYLLRDKDRKLIFSDPAEAAGVTDAQFHESIRAMLYWVYFGLKEQNYDFTHLLQEAVKQAEIDFYREYSGENIDVSVHFDLDITRSNDIKDTISAIEQGGPVQAKRLYDLLELPGGVPIDTTGLETVRVWFQSSYPKGEKAVLETMFSEYLGVDLEVEDAVDRVEPNKSIHGYENPENAVVDPDRTPVDPSEIKGHRSATDFEVDLESIRSEQESEVSVDSIRANRKLRQAARESPSRESGRIIDSTFDEIMENADSLPPSIYEVVEEQRNVETTGEAITPDAVMELMERVRDPFVSTVEVAAACGCGTGAARQALVNLQESDRICRRQVIDDKGSSLTIWWLNQANED